MNDIEVRLNGASEVARRIYSLNEKLGDRVVYLALRAGANVMLRKARSLAPVKTGRLRRAITVKNSRINRRRKNGKVGIFLTVKKGSSRKDSKGAYYGYWVEHGFNRGSRSVSGAAAVANGAMTKEELERRKLANAGTGKKVRARIGGQGVSGVFFMKRSYDQEHINAAKTIVDALELAGKKIVSTL